MKTKESSLFSLIDREPLLAAKPQNMPAAPASGSTLAGSGASMKDEAKPIYLFETRQAMESLRASGHDLFTAMAELVDNSIQARAKRIRIRVDARPESKDAIHRIVVGDDGEGMPADVLPMAIALGHSTRFGDRSGMGRFGVGATLGGISQARRIEYYSRTPKNAPFFYCCLDLDELKGQEREVMQPSQRDLPEDLKDLVGKTGTVAIWSKCDRIRIDGKHLKSKELDAVINRLMHYLGRTYRKFMDSGLQIEINGKPIALYDPLFAMTNPRFLADPKAEILLEESFDWPVPDKPGMTSKVRVAMTLLPEAWRLHRHQGDEKKNPLVKERKIHENTGFSILRADREIFFGTSHRFYPGGMKEADRWFGLEISFDPELDEHFAVRNVKKGAEPIDDLRDRIRKITDTAVVHARSKVREVWDRTAAEEAAKKGVHDKAEEIAKDFEKTAPKPAAEEPRPEAEKEQLLDEAAEAKKKATESKEDVEDVKKSIKDRPFSLIDKSWPSKEFVTTEHISPENSVVYLNSSHPFYQTIYRPIFAQLEAMADGDEGSPGMGKDELNRLYLAIDLLLISYAKAESMNLEHKEIYADLRLHWGMFLYNMLKKLKADT
jgi:hypothetical protein